MDLRKINSAVFRPWVVKETERLLGFEDEVVVEFVVRPPFSSSSLAAAAAGCCSRMGAHPLGPS